MIILLCKYIDMLFYCNRLIELYNYIIIYIDDYVNISLYKYVIIYFYNYILPLSWDGF